MIAAPSLAGAFTFSGTSITLNRMGYGAMQLAGPQVWGPPRDIDVAIAVLRAAVASGVSHIDTSDYYGPHVTNQIIKRALHPYPDGLVIVTKVGIVAVQTSPGFLRFLKRNWSTAFMTTLGTSALTRSISSIFGSAETLDLQRAPSKNR